MTDILTRAQRSRLMAKVRSSDNGSTELKMVKIFREYGITGWRRHEPLLGKPDFLFRKLRLAVFVDGCFWHGCPIHGVNPRQNAGFWRKKIARNKARDRQVNRRLRAQGWRVWRIWEHALGQKQRQRLLARFAVCRIDKVKVLRRD